MPRVSRDCPRCGAELVLVLTGKRADAERRADWMLKQGHVCDSCKDRQHEAEAARAQCEAQEKGYPALQGTDKQVRWALTLREGVLCTVEALVSELLELEDAESFYRSSLSVVSPQLWRRALAGSDEVSLALLQRRAVQVMEALLAKTQAGWWIDQRGVNPARIIASLGIDLTAPVAEDEVLFFVYPPEPKVQEAAIISRHGGDVMIRRCPSEVTQRFYQLHRKINYEHDSRAWLWHLDATLGEQDDRMAEVANFLLREGYPVATTDKSLLDKAVSGEFAPRHPHWLCAYGRSQYRVVIETGGTPALLREVRHIRGAKQLEGDWRWLVSASEWRSLREMADDFDIRVTGKADEVLRQAEARALAGQVGQIAPPPVAQVQIREATLSPVSQEIDSELRDD